MAARKNRGTKDTPMQEDWKKKIQATNIINRLNDCVEGKIELTSTQIKAADIILKKIVPDLARSEISGPNGGPIEITRPEDQAALEHYRAKLTGDKK